MVHGPLQLGASGRQAQARSKENRAGRPRVREGREVKAAIWARVSTSEQETGNQVEQLRQWAQNRGFEVVREWELEESAWNGAHRVQLNEALQSARLGEYQVLLTWALDRLSREGVEATLALLRQFRERGVMVWSQKESWTETSDPRQAELLTSLYAWMAAEESRRRSERTKAGLARARAAGAGQRGPDSKPRRKAGYRARWKRERESK